VNIKVVLDTNVFLSGVFFAGTPGRVLDACFSTDIDVIVSPEILDEYQTAGHALLAKHPSPIFNQFLAMLAAKATVLKPAPLPTPLCRDPKDDIFLACALASDANFIVSGDKDLLVLAPNFPIEIVNPLAFLQRIARHHDS
jgi:putative PIN family toxin of toxin-antitoxin system